MFTLPISKLGAPAGMGERRQGLLLLYFHIAQCKAQNKYSLCVVLKRKIRIIKYRCIPSIVVKCHKIFIMIMCPGFLEITFCLCIWAFHINYFIAILCCFSSSHSIWIILSYTFILTLRTERVSMYMHLNYSKCGPSTNNININWGFVKNKIIWPTLDILNHNPEICVDHLWCTLISYLVLSNCFALLYISIFPAIFYSCPALSVICVS